MFWAYQTSSCTATGETPFSLVYEGEDVVPAEIIISFFQSRDVSRGGTGELDLVDLMWEIS